MRQMIVILLTRAIPAGLLYGGFLLAISSPRFHGLLPLVVAGALSLIYLVNTDAKRYRDNADRASKD